MYQSSDLSPLGNLWANMKKRESNTGYKPDSIMPVLSGIKGQNPGKL